MVIIGSLDLRSDYIDDCPWGSVPQYIPHRVKGQAERIAIRDKVCG